MSGTTAVCQPGSVRKCVCRACKPHTRRKLFYTFRNYDCECKSKESDGRNSSVESLGRGSSNTSESDRESETPFVKRCRCIGCVPVHTEKRKRSCTCEKARYYPRGTTTGHGNRTGPERKISREDILSAANRQLSLEPLKTKSHRKYPSTDYDRRDNFEIAARRISTFLSGKKYRAANIENNIASGILVKPGKISDGIDGTERSSSERRASAILSFSRVKLVVEFDRARKRLLPLGGFFFESYRGKILDQSRSETGSDREASGKEGDSSGDNVTGGLRGKEEDASEKRDGSNPKVRTAEEMDEGSDKELKVRVPSTTAKETDPESELNVIKISEQRNAAEAEDAEYGKHDPNIMYYSKYITEFDSKRIIYGLHRLLHNYVMFRCEDRALTEGVISEGFIEKLSDGFELFLKNAYFYDPYYQPISFKRRYGYIELHLKVGVDDMFANKNRLLKKVFLVIFHRGTVKFILTRYNRPGKLADKGYNYATKTNKCRDVWCRLDFITAIVNRRHRRIRHRVIETLYDVLTADEKGFFKMAEPLDDLWVCIDFDTESEAWSKTERAQFIKMMRKESDPYFKENIKHVDPLETQLEKDRKKRKRKYKP